MITTRSHEQLRAIVTICLIVGLVIGMTTVAKATTIGPGADITDAVEFDTANLARLNVDRTALVTLPAGFYNVDDFRLNVATHDAGIGQAGTIAPMLLGGAPSSYTTLWVGPDYDPTTNGIQTVGYTAGSQQFALGVATNVYAGIFTKNQGSAIIALDQDNSGTGNSNTDHDTSYTPPIGAGESVTGISNPNLGRTYAFEVNDHRLQADGLYCDWKSLVPAEAGRMPAAYAA